METPFFGRLRSGLLVTSVALACLLGAMTMESPAHDSKAPKNANHNWLPTIDWVAFHWSPVDELQLSKLLGLTHRELYELQADDHRSFDSVATSKGLNLKRLRAQLFAPWKARRLTTGRARTIRRRISLMLSQPHLAQHVYWHPFHSPAFRRNASRSARVMYGVTLKRYRALRRSGATQLEIARIGGKSETHLRRQVIKHLKANRDDGIATRQTLPAQAERMYQRQRALVECWMRSPQPHFDPDIPFGGDVNSGHGPHRRADKVGVLNPKPAAGCWTPIVPGNLSESFVANASKSTTRQVAVSRTASKSVPMFCEL